MHFIGAKRLSCCKFKWCVCVCLNQIQKLSYSKERKFQFEIARMKILIDKMSNFWNSIKLLVCTYIIILLLKMIETQVHKLQVIYVVKIWTNEWGNYEMFFFIGPIEGDKKLHVVKWWDANVMLPLKCDRILLTSAKSILVEAI